MLVAVELIDAFGFRRHGGKDKRWNKLINLKEALGKKKISNNFECEKMKISAKCSESETNPDSFN